MDESSRPEWRLKTGLAGSCGRRGQERGKRERRDGRLQRRGGFAKVACRRGSQNEGMWRSDRGFFDQGWARETSFLSGFSNVDHRRQPWSRLAGRWGMSVAEVGGGEGWRMVDGAGAQRVRRTRRGFVCINVIFFV